MLYASESCRICLETSDVFFDFNEEFYTINEEIPLTFLECFVETTRVDIDPLDDKFPRRLCHSCGLELKSSYDFIKRAQNADKILRDNPNALNDLGVIKSLTGQNKSPSITLEKLNGCNSLALGTSVDLPYQEPQNNDLEVDTKILDTGDEEVLPCPECEETFFSQLVLNLHRSRLHKSESTVMQNHHENNEEVDEKIYPSLRPLDPLIADILSDQQFVSCFGKKKQCKLCGLTFCDGNEIWPHMHTVHKERVTGKRRCDVCGKTVNNIQEHMEKHLITNSTSDFVQHVEEKKPEKLVIPESNEEQNNMESTEKKLHCPKCPKQFLKTQYLKWHIGVSHSVRIKNVCCTLCPKKFYSKKLLNVHMISHNKTEHCKCDICGKKFLRKCGLKRHLIMHMGGKVKCTICSQPFPDNCELRVHMRWHTREKPYMCEVCGKSFALQAPLSCHMRQHTGQKYSCNFCDKVFVTQGSLRKHLYKHTGYPFMCPRADCKRGFDTKKRLIEHLKNKHNSELTREELRTIYSKIENSRLQ